MKCFHHPVVYLVIVTLFALIFLAVDQIPSDAEKHTVLDKILSQTQISLEQQGVTYVVLYPPFGSGTMLIAEFQDDRFLSQFYREVKRGELILVKGDHGWHASYNKGEIDYSNPEIINEAIDAIFDALDELDAKSCTSSQYWTT